MLEVATQAEGELFRCAIGARDSKSRCHRRKGKTRKLHAEREFARHRFRKLCGGWFGEYDTIHGVHFSYCYARSCERPGGADEDDEFRSFALDKSGRAESRLNQTNPDRTTGNPFRRNRQERLNLRPKCP